MRYIELGEGDKVMVGDMFVRAGLMPNADTKRVTGGHTYLGGSAADRYRFYPAWRVWREVMVADRKAGGYPRARDVRLPGNWVNANPLPLP